MAPPLLVTRFAPSPTGRLHLGHAFAARTAWKRARAAGGRFLLRIEDIDPERCRPEFTEAIYQDLRWLGLDWDGPVRVQSEHLADYRATVESLAARGLIYPCFCSRAEIQRELAASASAPHDPDGAPLYPGTCRDLPALESAARVRAGAPHAWRLNMAKALQSAQPLQFEETGRTVTADPAAFGDVVLARRHVPASYHLCATHDDALQGVTLVTRAEDLRQATHLHRLLQFLMGWPTPAYEFHPLLVGPDGRRLSKRHNAQTICALRDAGWSADVLLKEVVLF